MYDLEVENLKSVLYQQKIQPYFQNIVDENKNIVGVEVLARWVESEDVVFLPHFFIDKFEKKGLLVEFTCSLIEQVIGVISNQYDKVNINNDFYVCINITEDVLADFKFKTYIRHLSSYCHVVLELTEKNSIICSNCVRNDIQELYSDRIKFAIDDYGKDNSTLLLLYEYQFDILRLDKYFVSSLFDSSFFELNNKRKLIIKNIIDLCHNLGVRLIVEGIETQSQETLLKDMGVKFFQGYLYSRPSKTMGLFSKII
ncbi:EAL domain-containing protein [Photobacterium damselae]|uniref:EAL domain-containing protein n=1 Tax=Photobacterium damselae TaxID=38293 RepID=A0ABD6XCJ9_PHODM|nr:EAL domain-containing protein [Photobacterium damselae]PSU18753.1 hypothetical protein CTM90_01880 [Photobacterium damselae]